MNNSADSIKILAGLLQRDWRENGELWFSQTSAAVNAAF